MRAGIDQRPGVLLIAPMLGLTANNPRGERTRRLLPALIAAGFDVRVVTVDDGTLEETGYPKLLLHSGHAPRRSPGSKPPSHARSRLRGATGTCVRFMVPLPDSRLGWARRAYRDLATAPMPEGLVAIYAIGVPFSALALGAALSRRWGVPLACDIGDPWPRRGPAEALLRRQTLRRSSVLIVPTERMARSFDRELTAGQTVAVAPNGADRLISNRRTDRPLFLQVGSLARGRIDPEPAFRALAELDGEGKLEFASYGEIWVPLPPELAKHHHGLIGQARLREQMTEAAAVLVLGNRSPIGIPSKTFGILRSNVWGLYVSELGWELGAELVESSDHGPTVRLNHPSAIREAALSILDREAKGERPVPSTDYAWERTLEILVGVTNQLANA